MYVQYAYNSPPDIAFSKIYELMYGVTPTYLIPPIFVLITPFAVKCINTQFQVAQGSSIPNIAFLLMGSYGQDRTPWSDTTNFSLEYVH